LARQETKTNREINTTIGKKMKLSLCFLFVFGVLSVYGFPGGSPICSINTNSMQLISAGMGGPMLPLGNQGNVTMTANVTTAVAGSTIQIKYLQPATLIIGFLLTAEYQTDLTIQGSFDLTTANPLGFAIHINATLIPCPTGSNIQGAITQSTNNCDFALMTYNYKSDINRPGNYLFKSIVLVDGNYIPDARADWFVINPVAVTFTAAPGFTGFPTSVAAATTAAVNPANPTVAATVAATTALNSEQLAGVIIGCALGVLLISVFIFPIVWAVTHKHDPRVQRFTQRMTRTFGKS